MRAPASQAAAYLEAVAKRAVRFCVQHQRLATCGPMHTPPAEAGAGSLVAPQARRAPQLLT